MPLMISLIENTGRLMSKNCMLSAYVIIVQVFSGVRSI